MRNYILMVFLAFIVVKPGYSQTDTVVIVKTDTVFVTEKQDNIYKFYIQNKGPQTKHLWKLNFLKPEIGFEQRLAKAWSAEGYLGFGLYSFPVGISISSNDIITSDENSSTNESRIEQQFKYYYNLNRRQRLAKKTNGFSSNYIASSFYCEAFRYGSNHTKAISYNLGIRSGLQRRIGNLGYFEFYTGLYYRWEKQTSRNLVGSGNNLYYENETQYSNGFILLVGLKVGFAIDSFHNLKKMLKE